MTRYQRLVLDAVERCGEPFITTLGVYTYVRRRRWWTSIAGVLIALRQLEDLGYVTGLQARGETLVYKRTNRPDALDGLFTRVAPPPTSP